MIKLGATRLLMADFWTGWRRWVSWLICVSFVCSLGLIRTATDADFTLASIALLPVLAIAWIGGKKSGVLMAVLSASVLAMVDIVSVSQFNALWIPWANAITRLLTYSLVALLAAQVRLQFAREHEYATRDAMTGLLNRRVFIEAGVTEVERAIRYKHPLAVVFLDLDNFKKLNDTKGHAVGDAALKTTAKALLASIRSTDLAARFGGDEFAVLLPETEYEEATVTGRKISSVIIHALQEFSPVTVSVGVAWFGAADRTFPAMLKAADELMYEVKENGKCEMRSRRFVTMRNKPES
ncbi:MAG: diguanylate cyclase [Rugosibacter sp.]|nr:MAG: diguanylate cyclase [Rugosibacter sp.]